MTSHSIDSRDSTQARRGTVTALMAFMLPLIVLMAAFAINLCYMELNRTEMITATDAAVRAGGRELCVTRSTAAAKTRAIAIAAMNDIAGTPLSLHDDDLTFGTSQRPSLADRYDFVSGGGNPNALRVTARRTTGSLDGPIPLLMPSILGVSSFQSSHSAISSQIEVDVALVIDRSGSMAYAATEPAVYPPIPASAPPGWQFCDAAPPDSRWRNVVAGVDVFLNELASTVSNEYVSLSTYNEAAITDEPLTTNYSLIRTSLSNYTNSLCAGGTNIGEGISEGANALIHSPNSRDSAVKVIVLLTDGIHNTGSDPVDTAYAVADNGVMIYTITFSDEADQPRMQAVAYEGSGLHFHASSPSDLMFVFQEIAKRLPTLVTN